MNNEVIKWQYKRQVCGTRYNVMGEPRQSRSLTEKVT